MNKLIKLLLVGGLSLSLIGFITLFGLYLTTGISSVDMILPNNNDFGTFTVSHRGITFSQGDDKATSEIDESYDSITGIDINCSNCKVTIKEAKEDKVLLRGTKRVSSTASYELKDGVLVITLTNSSKLFNNTTDQITLLVPEKTVLVDSKIYTEMGKLEIEDVDFMNLDLELGLGDLRINDCEIDQANFVLDLGNFEFSGELKNKVTVINNLGNITMNIDEDLENVSYDCSLSLGDFKLNHKKEDSLFKKESSSEKLNLRIDASLGDIDLNFND